MDTKPSSIAFDAEGNAVLIDISGIGGITHALRAPEIRDEISPLDMPFEVCLANDTWAHGKLPSAIASHSRNNPFVETLHSIADGLMRDDVQVRMCLSEAILRLKLRG